MRIFLGRASASLFIAFVISLAASAANGQAAKPANLTGTWKLNIEKSDFGNGPKATKQSIFTIAHAEPALKFTVEGYGSDGSRIDMSFDGAIDQKPYPFKWNGRQAQLTITRIDAETTEGVLKMALGPREMELEKYTLTVSKDGKTLTRKATSMGGLTQTLVYDKQ
jgi:hypothetical protein